ncbi:MAG: hypothetical protein U9O41_10335 [Candidatus Aerophobetes bacterium]|nr:hypothetical protein [Candidatus Aerophobetes bacterium]
MGVIKFEVPDVVASIGVLETLLKREKLLLEKSISKTKRKLKEFEERKGMRSKEFFEKFQKGFAGDDQDTMIWATEYEAMKLLDKEHITIERMLSQCK